MAKQISFEKILLTLNDLTVKISEASDDCLNKRYASKSEDEQVILKYREKKYDRVNDLLYEIINEIETWLQV